MNADKTDEIMKHRLRTHVDSAVKIVDEGGDSFKTVEGFSHEAHEVSSPRGSPLPVLDTNGHHMTTSI